MDVRSASGATGRCCVSVIVAAKALLGALLISLLIVVLPQPTRAQDDYELQIQQMYVAYYGRPGDPAGVDYWAGRLAEVSDHWVADLISAFGDSAEYTARFGELADKDLIDNLFSQLYNRTADPTGLAYYVDLLSGSNLSGYNPALRKSSLAQIALDIANGSRNHDQVILRDKLYIADYFTTAIRTSGGAYGVDSVKLLAAVDGSPESLAQARTFIDSGLLGGYLLNYPLNDTGVNWCAHQNTNFLMCPVSGYPGQDAESGRDKSDNDDSDGQAGFSFTKLDSDGNLLPASATNWSCVRDEVTQLTWEVKSDNLDLHDKNDRYNWYNTDQASNGGFEGHANNDGNLCYSYDSIDPATYCNTQAYVARVNGQGLCGANDWRLPSIDELLSIVNYGDRMPAIDRDYFRNTKPSGFWSSTPSAQQADQAWSVSFFDGEVYSDAKDFPLYIRLVRER